MKKQIHDDILFKTFAPKDYFKWPHRETWWDLFQVKDLFNPITFKTIKERAENANI